MGSLVKSSTEPTMKSCLALLLLGLAYASGAPDPRFSCHECTDEMHKLGFMVKYAAKDIMEYLTANYCPTLPEDSHACEHDISRWYVGMLYTVVNHYFVDGAVHVCQTMGVCDAREYTCDECTQGLEWVEAYLEDPIMIAEFRIYLEQNFCLSDWDDCKQLVEEHFAGMHVMAMEKFFIPTEICMQEPVCGGSPTFPPKPTDGPDA